MLAPMPSPGKLEIVIKINELPADVTTTKHGWKEFKLDCGGRIVTVALRPRMWAKLEEASKQWPLWLAAISGQMGPSQGSAFVLNEPAVQVFERKARPPAEASPAEAPPEDTSPAPAAKVAVTLVAATPPAPERATTPVRRPEPARRPEPEAIEVVVRRRPAASVSPARKPGRFTPSAGG